MRYATLLMALMMIGCGGAEVRSVNGSVFLDGQPLTKVAITFYPETDMTLGLMSAQVESADGSFQIVPDAEFGQGRAGRYLVMVNSEVEMALMMAAMQQGFDPVRFCQTLGRPFLPLKYGSAATTPLVTEIAKGVNELEPFELRGESFPKCMKPKVIRAIP